jgi:phosphoglycolate phosphatase-like HAD superfamily hydrolase
MMPKNSETSEARIALQPGFQWDACPAYLFDIDGTLLRSRDRIHYNAFAEGVRRATGFELSLEGVALAGNTDTAILREACHQAGLPDSFLEQHAEAILCAMSDAVARQRSALDLVLMPGVEAALAHLAHRKALLGVATGNLEAIGWIKLEHAGLREWFRFGGFSDHFYVRSEMVGHAAAKAREMLGQPQAAVCVVGDTPRDIAAAHANQLPVIAVATGHYTFDELAALDPEVCASSLADLLAEAQPAQEQRP